MEAMVSTSFVVASLFKSTLRLGDDSIRLRTASDCRDGDLSRDAKIRNALDV